MAGAMGDDVVRVLIADDHAIHRIIFEEVVSAMGWRPTCVANGRLALDAVRHGDFDLVIMDVEMPEMSGIEATRSIRALEGPRADIAILAVTAGEAGAACLEAGADGLVRKPASPSELGEAMIFALEAGELRKSSARCCPGVHEARMA